MDAFAEGDVVMLNGDKERTTLTVESIERINNRVFVMWFDKEGNLRRADFDPSMLKKYQPPKRVSLAELRRRAQEGDQHSE